MGKKLRDMCEKKIGRALEEDQGGLGRRKIFEIWRLIRYIGSVVEKAEWWVEMRHFCSAVDRTLQYFLKETSYHCQVSGNPLFP